jgi:predicted ATPase
VTFLFTDIEGSTRLWESASAAMLEALETHDRIVKNAVDASGGYVFATGGDGFAAAFSRAGDAVTAAVTATQALAAHVWPPNAVVRVRMALHTGEAVERDGDYFGPAVNRAARLLSLAHGGQVICSQATAGIVGPGSLVPLGSQRLRDLDAPEQVFQVNEGAFPPLRSSMSLPTNLPVQRTSFVGRDRELKITLEAITQSALVTLTGVGGVGKTRLALETAGRVPADLADGVWLVELGAVADPDAVGEVTASALGVLPRPGQTPREAVLGYLGQRRLLLVIDNCEHLLDAVASLVDDILASCAGVRVLATSREALGVEGEQLVAVPTLGVPAADTDDADALRLLIERALTARPDSSMAPTSRAALAEVCRRVDGIPLAIELAAARLRSMTAEELAARLDQRFRMLVGSRRVAVSRQHTLRSTIDWSYDLLDTGERMLLQRAAVFAGGFDLAAAEAICSDLDTDVLDGLSRLADKSLLIADTTGSATRYRMLETIRDYATERLRSDQPIDIVRRLHAEYFAAWSATAGAGLRGPREASWVEAIEGETENLRTALLWSIDASDIDMCMSLVTPLMLETLPIDDTIGSLAELCLTVPGVESHLLYPQVAAFAAYSLTWRGRPDDGRRLLAQARAALDAGPAGAAALVRILSSETISTTALSGFEDAARSGEARVAAARVAGDDYELCRALAGLSAVRARIVDDDRAPAEEAITIARRLRNPLLLSSSLYALAQATLPFDRDRAIELLRESEAHATNNDRVLSVVQGLQAELLQASGDLAGVAEIVLRTVELEWARHHHLHTSHAGLSVLIKALTANGRDEVAAVLEGVCALEIFYQPLDQLPERLGEDRYGTLHAKGAAMEESEIVSYLRSIVDEISRPA